MIVLDYQGRSFSHDPIRDFEGDVQIIYTSGIRSGFARSVTTSLFQDTYHQTVWQLGYDEGRDLLEYLESRPVMEEERLPVEMRVSQLGDDAAAWAASFMETFPNCGIDEGTMIGWFANAIEVGRGAKVARRVESQPSSGVRNEEEEETARKACSDASDVTRKIWA